MLQRDFIRLTNRQQRRIVDHSWKLHRHLGRKTMERITCAVVIAVGLLSISLPSNQAAVAGKLNFSHLWQTTASTCFCFKVNTCDGYSFYFDLTGNFQCYSCYPDGPNLQKCNEPQESQLVSCPPRPDGAQVCWMTMKEDSDKSTTSLHLFNIYRLVFSLCWVCVYNQLMYTGI